VFIPLTIGAKILVASDSIIFFGSALSIIPLASYMGEATEGISSRTTAAVGGLLSATFGNATELVIGIVALSHGLIGVVQASIAGSIIGNLLLVLGMSMIAGGWKREKQTFKKTAALASAATLLLAAIALVIPAFFVISGGTTSALEHVSIGVSIIMIISYLMMLAFSLSTHKHLYTEEIAAVEHAPKSLRRNIIVLIISTLFVAVMSELLVGSIEPLVQTLGWSETFIGVIFVAIIGNAAEHASAITMALKNRMDLSFQISVGSSVQIALFVAPLLVLISLFYPVHMGLLFSTIEVGCILFSVLITNLVIQDGESNWLEGSHLIMTYLIIAISFFFLK
jgi:Ca2+:H+ antiporter